MVEFDYVSQSFEDEFASSIKILYELTLEYNQTNLWWFVFLLKRNV